MKPNILSIVIKVEMLFNGNLNNFYDKLYKNRITYSFIRSELGLSEDVKIKLDGGFTRDLYYLDERNNDLQDFIKSQPTSICCTFFRDYFAKKLIRFLQNLLTIISWSESDV